MVADRGILEDLNVVALTAAIAGPLAGKLLGDNGAHVTRVEPPWGANFRNRNLQYDTHDIEEFTYRFLMYNTGKESIAIDLKTETGKEILWKLINRADVLLENMTAGTMARLGFDWETMHERNPELVYCSITGYGEDGPYSDLPAYDATIQGVSGWIDQIGESDHPEKMSLPAIDHATGLYAVNGILMALLDRYRTGTGQRVDVAMIDVAISILGHPLAEYSGLQADETVEPIYGKANEPGGVFEVADGYISLNVTSEHWPSFCEAIGKEGFTETSHRFSTVMGRVKHARMLRRELENVLTQRTAEEWFKRFDEVAPKIVYAPANRIPELLDDPHVKERDLIQRRNHPVMGAYYLPAPALRFSAGTGMSSEAPKTGEHTDEILTTIGYSTEERQRFRNDGIVYGE